MERRWLVLVAVSLMFFFISSATFMSLGLVLPSMMAELKWSQTEAGATFSVLGLACCLASLLPMILVRRVGTRWTMFMGAMMLAVGFLLGFVTQGLMLFLVGTALMGVGFALCANIPGVYLLARWFPEKSARVIGIYFMCGAAGGVVGPPLAADLVASMDWRSWWMILAVTATIMSLVCIVLVRDRPLAEDAAGVAIQESGPDAANWPYKEAMRTPQFALLAAAMIVTQACVTVMHSAAAIHFKMLGHPAAFAAGVLGFQALMAAIAKGLSGAVGERVNPRLVLVGGLTLEAVGFVVLSFASTPLMAGVFAVTFGVGWGAAYLAITVLMIKYFGPRTGSDGMSLVWLLTVIAALAPAGAGMVADSLGSFGPAFVAGALMLLPIAVGLLIVRDPVRKSLHAGAGGSATGAIVESVA